MSLFRNHAKPKQQPKIRIERVVVERSKPGTSSSSTTTLTDRPRAIARSLHSGLSTPFGSRRSPMPSPSPRSSPNPSFDPSSSRSSSVAISTPASISTSGLSTRPRISSPLTSSDELQQRKRKAGSAQARSPDRVTFDSSSESEDDDWLAAIDPNKRKKRMRLAVEDDPDRVLLESASFEEAAKQKGKNLVHAVDLSSVKLGCTPAFEAKGDDILVKVQYPSLYPREEFELVWGKDKIDAVSSIIAVVQHVADFYLTDEQARPFVDDHNGIIRRLTKASNVKVQNLEQFRTALYEYNKRLRGLVQNGTIRKALESKHGIPSHLVSFILEQVYDRTVAPKVELLSKYENGTDNVYGELLAPFITNILVEKLHMKSNQVFVDLGSGVGNVVIQAALEIGCESWGCEMMENACQLGDDQVREFKARCKMWGLATGRARLEHGDFRHNARILEALKRADVVLVNNKAFTSQLNDDLVRMFLDLKKGCKIVSLKSFVNDHKSNHNINDVGSTILDVEEHLYPEGYVSWTNAGGSYFISTRK